VKTVELNYVAYMPSRRTNLMSYRRNRELGYPAYSDKMIARVQSAVLKVRCQKTHDICELTGMRASWNSTKSHALFIAGKDDGPKLMHKQTCHTGVKVPQEMVRTNPADGISELTKQSVDYEIGNE